MLTNFKEFVADFVLMYNGSGRVRGASRYAGR